jgi:hypothetical protein
MQARYRGDWAAPSPNGAHCRWNPREPARPPRHPPTCHRRCRPGPTYRRSCLAVPSREALNGCDADFVRPRRCRGTMCRRDVETFRAATRGSSRAQLPAGARALRPRAAIGTKRHTEQRGARSERPKREDGVPKREDGVPADRPHPVQRRQGGPDRAASPGADGRVASAPTTRRRTSRTSAAPTTPQHRRRLTGATPPRPTTGKGANVRPFLDQREPGRDDHHGRTGLPRA